MTPPFHGGNRGSNPLGRAMAARGAASRSGFLPGRNISGLIFFRVGRRPRPPMRLSAWATRLCMLILATLGRGTVKQPARTRKRTARWHSKPRATSRAYYWANASSKWLAGILLGTAATLIGAWFLGILDTVLPPKSDIVCLVTAPFETRPNTERFNILVARLSGLWPGPRAQSSCWRAAVGKTPG